MNDFFDPQHVASRLKRKDPGSTYAESAADYVVTIATHLAQRSQHQKNLMKAEILGMQAKASEQAMTIIDLQAKIAELERRLG